MCFSGSLLDCTPGNGTGAAAAALMQMPVCCIAKSDAHKSLLQRGITETLERAFNDTTGPHYLSDVDLGVTPEVAATPP